MHVVIGAITAIAGLIWALAALQRSGFALDSLNPFLAYRRAQWRKKYSVKPLHNLDEPMEAAAVLVLGTVKCEGEITTEQKTRVMEIFTQVFKLSPKNASALMVSSAYLLRDETYIAHDLENILEKSKSKFTQAQQDSVFALMEQVARVSGQPNPAQRELITAARKFLGADREKSGKWI